MQEICNIDKKQFVTFSNSMMKDIACISLQLLQGTFLKNTIAYACVNSYKKLDWMLLLRIITTHLKYKHDDATLGWNNFT